MSERWYSFIQHGLGTSLTAAAFESWRFATPILDRIRARVPSGRIMELGCGAGLNAVLLAAWGYEVTAIDNDPRICELAKDTALRFGEDVRVECRDVQEVGPSWGSYDVVFSFGLMEHFDRAVTVDLLRRQRQIAREVVTEIPSKHMVHAGPQTDERVYDLAGLRGMYRDAGMVVAESFCYSNVPTLPSRWLSRLLPLPAYRLLQNRCSYGLALVAFGR